MVDDEMAGAFMYKGPYKLKEVKVNDEVTVYYVVDSKGQKFTKTASKRVAMEVLAAINSSIEED